MKLKHSPRPKPAESTHAPLRGAVLILLFALGLYVGQQVDLLDVAGLPASLFSRVQQSLKSPGTLPHLRIDMAFENYQMLLAQRAAALEKGVVQHERTGFIPCEITVSGQRMPAEIRLMEGPTRHLGPDEKWNFELRTTDLSRPLFGLHHAYLQDPADNHALNQWAFVQHLRQEGFQAARYSFVRLMFNGDDRGVYTLQEGFGLVDASSDLTVAFETDSLWEFIAHFDGNVEAAYADPVAAHSAYDIRQVQIATLADTVLDQDAETNLQYARALARLYEFQISRRPAEDVFDAEWYGRFLALVDLWGATEGLKIANVHYNLDLESGRFVPIGFNSNALGSSNRLPLVTTYDSSVIQAAYVREALRLSEPAYVDRLEVVMAEAWPEQSDMLRAEGIKATAPWDTLRERQDQMRRSLRPMQPIFAYLDTAEPPYDVLRLRVANALQLPIELVEVDINGATVLPIASTWLDTSPALLTVSPGRVVLRGRSTERQTTPTYLVIAIPLSALPEEDPDIDFNQPPDLHIITRILGATEMQRTRVMSNISTRFP